MVPVLSSSRTSTAPAAFTATRGGDDIGCHHAAHAGDADGRQQTADGGRNETDQQRDQHGDRDRSTELGYRYAEQRKRQQSGGGQQKHQGQGNQQNRQRDFIRGLLPLGPFDHGDHAIDEGFAGIHGNANHQPVRQYARAAGDG